MKICLDAGHYGNYNQSPANKSYYEAKMAWKLTNLQKKYLQQYGFTVVLTRSNEETDLALLARGKKAKGCGLFISNHSNATGASTNNSVDYPCACVMSSSSSASLAKVSSTLGLRLARVIQSTMGTKQAAKTITRVASSDRDGNGRKDDEYYGVLQGAKMVNVPGIILEHSFHTNKTAATWLLSDTNLDKLAKAEAACIASYFGITTSSKPVSYYYVQVGAYSLSANAKEQMAKVIKAGFSACIVSSNKLYKVKAGTFSSKANAEALVKKLNNKGFAATIVTSI